MVYCDFHFDDDDGDTLFLKAEACFNRPTFFSVPCTFLFGEFDPVLTGIETDACLKGRKNKAASPALSLLDFSIFYVFVTVNKPMKEKTQQ